MTLSRRAAAFLVAVAAFDVFEWVTLIRNIAGDHQPGHGAAFHAVHYVLAALNLLIACGLAALGARGWRAARRS